jgi:MerR family copper efflux transcriptional regulator
VQQPQVVAEGANRDRARNIGSAASETGVTPKTIRYYESIGLIPEAVRSEGGYRQYSEKDVQTLHFIARSRSLGFSVAEIEELLSFYRDHNRTSADVKAVVEARIGDIEKKVAELSAMKAALAHLAEKCHGDDRPDCPILEDLSGRNAS